MRSVPVIKDIVLLGGGHSHALLLRQWAMEPVAGIRLTLISRDVLTPYSGMLPGYVAGHYTRADIHMDLSRLCRWANCRFIEATITGVRTRIQEVELVDRPAIGYDILSIDTGSTPDTRTVPGADRFTVPVKPIHRFQHHWESFRKRLDDHAGILNIAVVGSGVGGFELLLAMHYRLSSLGERCRFHWIIRGDEPIRSHPPRARRLALTACKERGIDVHTGFNVVSVTEHVVAAEDGRQLPTNEVFWCTAAAAPDWPGESGLETDRNGFIATNAYLQSRSHSSVFASGDVATQIQTPNEKAGVFAVRQAPVLFQNLRRYALGLSLKRYSPQKQTLSLMALGRKSAIACRGSVTVEGDWVWRWKDHIDRSFMRKFSHLAPRRMTEQSRRSIPDVLLREANMDPAQLDMRCGGCGAKVSADVLTRTIGKLEPVSRQDILVGLDASDDAAVFDPGGLCVAQSVDQFRAMLEDPFLLGRIAALHALSDLHAMGATPHSALAIVAMPHASESVLERDLVQSMSGAIREFNAGNCALIGGHTSEGAEMSIGFTVNGLLHSKDLTARTGLRVGDRLILTKAIGTGVLLAADMQALANGPDVNQCIASMLISNQSAAKILRGAGASAITDITGFGLLGHLREMLRMANIGCDLMTEQIPLLAGALALSASGVRSTLYAANSRYLQSFSKTAKADDALIALLCDPQTSGGLLAGVCAENADDCIEALHKAGHNVAAVVGLCRPGAGDLQII